jgi:hypothetical protein
LFGKHWASGEFLSDSQSMSEDHSDQAAWQTLESNPDVLTAYAVSLGLSRAWHFVDVLSCAPEMRSFVPRSAVAFLVVVPLSDVKRSEALLASIDADDDRVVFVKQQVANACGTIGVIHAVSNNRQSLDVDRPTSLLAQFARTDLGKSELAALAEASSELKKAHEEATQQSVSAAEGHRGDLHFVCFTSSHDRLFELDGRTPGPIDRGACGANEFVDRCCDLLAELMASSGGALTFSITALCKVDSDDAPNSAAIGQLMDMGVVRDRDHAAEVLAMCGSIEAALSMLL